RVLRTTLRQDPDIIMVGEMRDRETVEIGLRGALTGHLVLSTLHTNDSISSAIRLLDMGAPGYLVASSLRAIIAQRLVRRICDNCCIDEEITIEASFWLKTLNEDISDTVFKKGAGCQKCNHSGYRGRVGVFELLEMTEGMMNALKNNDTSLFSDEARISPDYKPLAHSALLYAKEGITSIAEVLKLVEMVGDAAQDEKSEHTVEEDVPKALARQTEQAPSKINASLQTGFSGSGLSLEDDD
ncbi:MAG: MSHA biogenesis protein MshE, partial [Granulosicoccus sp.]